MLDRCGRLDGFDLEGGTDVGQGAWAERKGLRMVLLPPLVFRTEIERSRVLEVGRKNDGLIACLAGKLDTEIPRIEGHEGELEVLGQQMFLGKGIEPVDSIPEGTCRPDMFPGQGGQARCRSNHISADRVTTIRDPQLRNTCNWRSTRRNEVIGRG